MIKDRTLFSVTYSINDLRRFIDIPIIYKPVNFYKDLPLHLCDERYINGEYFKIGKVYNDDNDEESFVEVKASNYGRVLVEEKLYLQKTGIDKNYNYLYLDNYIGDYLPAVHRIVAFVWCERPTGIKSKDLQVHHINNNGFDNRPCNLLWVTKSEHELIEQDYLKRSMQYSYNDYEYI